MVTLTSEMFAKAHECFAKIVMTQPRFERKLSFDEPRKLPVFQMNLLPRKVSLGV